MKKTRPLLYLATSLLFVTSVLVNTQNLIQLLGFTHGGG